MRLRPYDTADADAVLALNQANLDAVGWLDADRLEWLAGLADTCLVADDGGVLAGFTIVLAPGTAYDSVNYGWFGARLDDFAYLDRVVVAPQYRRRGVGTLIYDAAEERARAHGRMALEVYVDPPNAPSLTFHERRGYGEVGRLVQANGKTCSMLVKELQEAGVQHCEEITWGEAHAPAPSSHRPDHRLDRARDRITSPSRLAAGAAGQRRRCRGH